MSKALFARLASEQAETERALVRDALRGRRAMVKNRWRRRVARPGEVDITDKLCPLCWQTFLTYDPILVTDEVPSGCPEATVFHGSCLEQAAKLANPHREFDELKKKMITTQELFPQ